MRVFFTKNNVIKTQLSDKIETVTKEGHELVILIDKVQKKILIESFSNKSW